TKTYMIRKIQLMKYYRVDTNSNNKLHHSKRYCHHHYWEELAHIENGLPDNLLAQPVFLHQFFDVLARTNKEQHSHAVRQCDQECRGQRHREMPCKRSVPGHQIAIEHANSL